MNRINEIDNTIEGKEIKTYYQDHPELVVLSGRLYGKVTYVEFFDAYYLQFGDNVYYFPQKDSYQEGKNWKKKKFDSYEECLNFSQQHNIKIVMKSTVKSPFSNGLPDTRFLFPERNIPYDLSERTDVSRIRENKHNTNMNKKPIRLTENDLHKIVKESVNKILNETKKKDPMSQWFKDMNDIQKHRDNMEYITKGGRKPKHWKRTNEGIENETRFLPHLKRTYENLYREYEHWQYATYKPQGMDDAIDAIIAAMHSVQDIIREIEPNDNIPTWEDPQQY